MDCKNCEKALEFEKVIERTHELLVTVLPKITDPEVLAIIRKAIAQTMVRYHDYGPKADVPYEANREKAISHAITRADEKSKETGEPCIVAETPAGQILITRRSRFEREKPFGTAPEAVIYDTETGRKKNA